MKSLVMFLMLLFIEVLNGQNFAGIAQYKTHRKTDITVTDTKGNVDEGFQKKIREQMKKMFQKTYTLHFSKDTSIYTQNSELEPEVKSGGIKFMMLGSTSGSDVLFKNISKKAFTNKTEISGKVFLIKDTLPILPWEMTSETKKIGNYTCYKATKSRVEEQLSFTITDGEKEEKKEKVTIETIVWYTPEIPVSNGPAMYWGLPGLILEVQEGEQTIVCSELVLNPTKKVKIEAPTKGKKVTQEKFDAIMEKKTKEILERFKNNRKTNGKGSSINLNIQG